MAFFAVLGLILLLGVAGKRPGRVTYGIVALAAAAASVYEYLK
jgi:hypothetical protein